MKADVVYILQNDYKSDEIIYSIRSVVKNFPYRKIWFYGGKPDTISADCIVEIAQDGQTKWDKVTNTIRQICLNDEITENFWLFNDDFFVMQKVKKLEPMVGGTLWYRAQKINKNYAGKDSRYSMRLKDTARILRDNGYDRLDYALHVPMLINRKKGLQTIEKFQGYPMFRSLYGNHHKIGGVITDDVKIQDEVTMPTGKEIFLSTDDTSFAEGKVGEYIRNAFPEPCKYE